MAASKVSGKELPMFIIDAFSSTPFCGNPAAICMLEYDQEINDETKQRIGLEMNLSETAFVSKLNSKDTFQTGSTFGLRWFTPKVEVPLCGHATLATAAALFYCQGNTNDTLRFETMSGLVHASRKNGKVVLDFPIMEPKPLVNEFMNVVKVASCGFEVIDVQMSSTRKLLVRLKDGITRSEFESLNPDAPAMRLLTGDGSITGDGPIFLLILTVKSAADDGYDFYSRIFAPWLGVNEDPVCGSAHCVLIPYWAKILGKKELKARQCSNRGGDLYLKLRDDGRVDIGGEFSVTLKGSVIVP